MSQSKKWGIILLSVVTISVIVGVELLPNNDFSESTKSTLQVGERGTTYTTDNKHQSLPPNTVPSIDVLGYQSNLGPLPGSLEGTIMANALVVDEGGNLRISSDIRRVFDYFLSTINEEPLETVLARINEYLENHLESPALSQAKQILVGYIDLKKALYDFEIERSALMKQYFEEEPLTQSGVGKLLLLEEQLQARNELRAQHLSLAVYEAFYEDEQIFDQYTLDRMKVMADTSLSESEQLAALDQIDSVAPEHLVLARQETQITDTLKKRTTVLREQGADDNDIRVLRTEMFGEEAADRFDELDKKRAEWKQRLDQYLAQRSQILATEGLSLDARELQVEELRTSQFDTREQIRVKVFERQTDV